MFIFAVLIVIFPFLFDLQYSHEIASVRTRPRLQDMKKYLFVLFFLIPAFSFADVSDQQLYENYYSLSNALARDSVQDAHKAAMELDKNAALLLEARAKQADPIKPESPPKDENETIRQYLATLSQLSKTILKANSLDGIRKPFEEITAVMAGLQVHTKIQAQEYYCPMVKKVWLQPKDSKEVVNPYMGKDMIHCGEKKVAVKK